MHFKEYKTIISPHNGMNIYRGCSHGCIYCDSRSTCYQMDHVFEDIEVKLNAPLILDAQLKKRREASMITTGAMSDPYIHLEEKLEYTRKCLEVIEKNGFGVTLLTKSDRVLRDIDILKRINDRTKCVVQMTLTTADEKLCKIIEPNASTTKERVDALKTLKEADIPTVVWLGPFLPFINDTEENLQQLLNYCLEAGVKGIICFGFGLTMREGNREYLYSSFEKHFPRMKEKYIKTYGNKYSCSSQNHKKLYTQFINFCNKNNIHYNKNTFAYLGKFETKIHQVSLF